MEITDIETIHYTYESRYTSDEKGHGHPGEPHEATGSITRVVTDTDVDGYCTGGSEATNDLAAEYLVGEDPMERNQIWQRLERTQRLHKSTFADGNISAIDCALWDFAGRYLEEPVYRLLGGHREEIPAYGSTMVGDDDPDGLGTPEAYADFAEHLVEEVGYPAVKLHSWMPPYEESPGRTIEACAAVRERVGPDIDLMLDSHHFYSRTEAKRIADALADLEYLWFEEPMNEHSMSSYEWLTRETDIQIVGPETAEGKMQTRAEWIKRDVADIARVGVGDVGGITPAVKTAHLCESFGVECEVHGGGPANLHLLASMPIDGRYYERGLLHPNYDYDRPNPIMESDPVPFADGHVSVPDRPGLGYEFDWEYIEENSPE